MTSLSILFRIAAVVILVILTLVSAGCYGSKETEDVAYVLLIGVDKADAGNQKVTYQIALPQALSGGDTGKGGSQKEPWVINSVVAPSPAEARMLLKSTMSRSPSVSHFNIYIFSEELAREGLSPSLSFIARNPEYRETLFLIIVPGSAEAYIRQNKPTLENQIAKFYELSLLSASEGSYSLRVNFHDFYTRLKNSGGSPYTIYSGINPKTGENKPAGAKAPEQKGDPYLSGGAPRTGTENPVEFLGLAVFRGDKMVGVLNSDETMAVAILQGRFAKGYIDVIDPLKPEKHYISLNVRCDPKPKIVASLNDGSPVFDVEVNIEGEILGIFSGINYEAPDYREIMEKQVANMYKNLIMNALKHTQELGVDPVGFGLYLRPHFRNTGELNQVDTTALYQAADIRVNVTAKIRRTGLIWRTSPVKDR